MKLHFFSAAFIEYLVGFGPYSLGALLHFFFYHNFVYVWSNSCFFSTASRRVFASANGAVSNVNMRLRFCSVASASSALLLHYSSLLHK